MVHQLLTEEEPFSDIDERAISRWVANVAQGTQCVVACPSFDSTWGFAKDQLLELPAWRFYGRLKTLLQRGGKFLEPAKEWAELSSFKPLLFGGIPEVLQFGGGVCVPPGDAAALANALERLIVDRAACEPLGAEGLQSFRKHFSWQIIRKRYLEIVEEVKA